MDYLLLVFVEIIGLSIAINYAKKCLVKMNSSQRINRKEEIILIYFHIIFFVLLYRKKVGIFYYASLSSLLICMAISDYKEKRIANTLFIGLFIFSILSFVFLNKSFINSLLGSILGSLPLIIILKIKKDSVGEGDIYFLSLLGLIVEMDGIYIVLLCAYFLAFLYSVYLCIHKKANRKSEIAMFPFFYIGYLVFLLFYA